MTAGFYQYETACRDFECFKNGVDISINNIGGEFYIRMDDNENGSVQMVLDRNEFGDFIKHCQDMLEVKFG